MTSEQLAKELGISRRTIFKLRKQFPDAAPTAFGDVSAWRSFLDATKSTVKINPPTKKTSNLDDIARYNKARADKTEFESARLSIELQATRREILTQAEILALFGHLASVLRGKLLKAKNDIPAACAGLNEIAIEAIVQQKFDDAMSTFVLPADLFKPRGIV